jgi:hypothetical protein
MRLRPRTLPATSESDESVPHRSSSRSQALLLSADYFKNTRLTQSARGTIAAKHRNRIRSALFGQLMASFEFCIKDFIAQVVDASDAFDDVVSRCKWIEVDKSRILAQRDVAGSVGALLIHPLLGWHYTDEVNAPYEPDCTPDRSTGDLSPRLD